MSRRSVLGAVLAAPGILLSGRPSGASGFSSARLVSLDLLITEMLLTLGETPLAISNIPLYRRLVASPALPGAVKDLGPFNEPNREFLQGISPGGILVADWQAPNLQSLNRIAPVIPVKVFPGKVPALSHSEALLQQIAAMTGREATAKAAIAGMWQAIEQASSRLSGFGRKIYICRFNRDGRNIALFGGNGMLADVVARVGLENAFTGRVNGAGVTNAALSRLADDPEAIIVHFDRGAETDVAVSRLEQNALWNVLPAVRAGRVVRIPVIYPNGGIHSAGRFAEQLRLHLAALAHG